MSATHLPLTVGIIELQAKIVSGLRAENREVELIREVNKFHSLRGIDRALWVCEAEGEKQDY